MNETELRELVREEVSAAVAEGGTDTLRKSFYAYSDGVYGMKELAKQFPKDRGLAKITNELVKLLDKVESHLDNNYKGWD